jgi:hypothetical protein
MKEYLLASEVWNASIAHDLERTIATANTLTKDLDISKCPTVATFVQAVSSKPPELIETTPMSSSELGKCLDNPRCFAAMREEAAVMSARVDHVMTLCKIGEKLGIIPSAYNARKTESDRLAVLEAVGEKGVIEPLWTCAAEQTTLAARVLRQ